MLPVKEGLQSPGERFERGVISSPVLILGVGETE